MSEPRLHPEILPSTNEPYRIAVRRLRWFKQAFTRYAEASGRELGCTFEIDEAKLAAVFVRWLGSINAQKPSDRGERRAFFEFAASLMLRELTSDMPLKAIGVPSRVDPGSAAAFWPEGYVCTMFCLSVNGAAVEQEFHTRVEIDPAIDDLRHWWSFRENAHLDTNFSAGFLQMLLGHQPNWLMPSIFRERIVRDIDEAS